MNESRYRKARRRGLRSRPSSLCPTQPGGVTVAAALDLDCLAIRILQGVAERTHRLSRLSVHFVERKRCRLVPCQAPRNPSPQ
jgi:hypothetical protein